MYDFVAFFVQSVRAVHVLPSLLNGRGRWTHWYLASLATKLDSIRRGELSSCRLVNKFGRTQAGHEHVSAKKQVGFMGSRGA